jgi:hypothetical protein
VDIFHRFFELIVERCQHAGLVWGQELYRDATHVLADAALDSLAPRFVVEARTALQAHLDALFPEQTTSQEATPTAPNVAQDLEQTAATPPPALSLPRLLPADLRGAEREELAAASSARQDWIAAEGKPHRALRRRHNYCQRVADFRISTTDSDATPLRLKSGGTHLGYQTHYVVDGGKRRITLGVLVAPGEGMENQPMLDLAWHVRFRFHLRPHQAIGDANAVKDGLAEKGVDPRQRQQDDDRDGSDRDQ